MKYKSCKWVSSLFDFDLDFGKTADDGMKLRCYSCMCPHHIC